LIFPDASLVASAVADFYPMEPITCEIQMKERNTMISDILADSVNEIEKCQRRFQDMYGPLKAEIDVVKTVMDCLRAYLDAAPGVDKALDDSAENLSTAIKSVDLSPVRTACKRLVGGGNLDEQHQRSKKLKINMAEFAEWHFQFDEWAELAEDCLHELAAEGRFVLSLDDAWSLIESLPVEFVLNPGEIKPEHIMDGELPGCFIREYEPEWVRVTTA
jgi:hypothetical protein